MLLHYVTALFLHSVMTPNIKVTSLFQQTSEYISMLEETEFPNMFDLYGLVTNYIFNN